VTTRRGRPTHAEAKELDLAIREAAVAAFVENGYAGTSMEAIARAANITKRTLYARYADKRAVFAEVIPWALARSEHDGSVAVEATDDVEADLLAFGRMAVNRALRSENVRLKRIAMTESALFPEFSVSADSMMWAARQRALTELLRGHEAKGNVVFDDVELAAEHFLAMVEAVPARMADFGVFRSKKQQDRHLQYAVSLFLRGTLPR
jgi:AcrR family transcriptional regulator